MTAPTLTATCPCGNTLTVDTLDGLCEWCEIERDMRTVQTRPHRLAHGLFGTLHCTRCGMVEPDALDCATDCPGY